MRRAAPVVLLLVLAACTASRVKPEANISISGSVHQANGKPVTGAKVALVREGDPGDVFITVTTIGLACLGPNPRPTVCDRAQTTTTSGDGRFDYKLKGRDTQATFGTSAVLAILTAMEAKELEVDGSSITYRFHAQTEELSLPLRMWEPVLAARTGSFGARVTFPRVPSGVFPAEIRRAPVRYAIEFDRDDEAVWRIPKATPNTRFDPRVLEDSTGTMRAIAGVSSVDVPDTLGDEVAVALRSGTRAYASPLDAPPSRGKPCSVPDAEGNPVTQSPCRLTDGAFEDDFRPVVCAGRSGCTEPPHESATVDLGATGPVDLIVVRGCFDSCRVETSSDAKSWRLAGVTSSELAAVSPTGAVRARYVRVSGRVDRLWEVSVWRDLPRVPDASLLVAPPRFPTGGSGRGSTTNAAGPGAGDDQGVWPLVATGLLGAVAGGLAVAFARRRSSGVRRAG
jgi:hypothetical protein